MTETPWEDSLLERKLEGDLKDLLKTLVAFANSVRPGHVATILIGEADDGSVPGVTNPDHVEKEVRKQCDRIYPAIVWKSQVYANTGTHCVRVEIEHNGETPHFGGLAWVRKGSETVKATDEVFQRLIDFRLSKVQELGKWINKKVSVEGDVSGMDARKEAVSGHPRWPGTQEAQLSFVNAFWATFEVGQTKKSEPLDKLLLSWDDARQCLKLLVKE